METLKLSFQEILRAANPGRRLLIIIAVLWLVLIFTSAMIELYVGLDNRQRISDMRENQVLERMAGSTAPVSTEVREIADWTMQFLKIMLETYRDNGESLLIAREMYRTFLNSDISPEKYRDVIEPIVGTFKKSSNPSIEDMSRALQEIGRLADALFRITPRSFGRDDSRNLAANIFTISPIPEKMHRAYADLWKSEQSRDYAERLLADPEATVRILNGSTEEILHEIRPQPKAWPFWRSMTVPIVLSLLIASVWTFSVYTATIMRIGALPWNVQWNVAVCILALFWVLPIAVTLPLTGIQWFAIKAGLALRAPLFWDLTCIRRIFNSKTENFYKESLYENTLAELYLRKVQIEHQLQNLRAKKALGEPLDNWDDVLQSLKTELENVEGQIALFEPYMDTGTVSDLLEKSVASQQDREEFWEAYETRRKINPSIPPLISR